MGVISLLLLFGAALTANMPDEEVDLSRSVQNFPTHTVSVRGCNAAYDNPDRRPPASCKPFPVTLEITGVRPSASDNDHFVLAVLVKNISNHLIELPKSLQEIKGGGRETFISFEVYSPPDSKAVKSVSYAFADTKTPSSVAHVNPGEAVIYELPFNKQATQENVRDDHAPVRVFLRAYSLERSANTSDGISNQLGNEIVSEPFTPKR